MEPKDFRVREEESYQLGDFFHDIENIQPQMFWCFRNHFALSNVKALRAKSINAAFEWISILKNQILSNYIAQKWVLIPRSYYYSIWFCTKRSPHSLHHFTVDNYATLETHKFYEINKINTNLNIHDFNKALLLFPGDYTNQCRAKHYMHTILNHPRIMHTFYDWLRMERYQSDATYLRSETTLFEWRRLSIIQIDYIWDFDFVPSRYFCSHTRGRKSLSDCSVRVLVWLNTEYPIWAGWEDFHDIWFLSIRGTQTLLPARVG